MGKATILSHLGDGQYRIRIKFDNTLIELRKTYIDQQIVAINTELNTLNTQKLAAKIQYDADIASLNDYIDNTPVQDYISNPTAINALTIQVYKSRSAYDAVIRLEKHAKLKRTQLSKDKDYLVNFCPADYETTAWCTEYKTDLSGDVNTIEIDYGHRRDPFTDVTKNDTGFWLVNELTYPQTGNNQLQHPFESSVHACWYNLAMLPAMQRDEARFRVATILDKATGYIEFNGQSEPNNFAPVLITEKPIFPEAGRYLTGARLQYPCSDKYANGDRVIVELQPADNGIPRVIGFYENPKKCADITPPDFPEYINIAVGADIFMTGEYSNILCSNSAISATYAAHMGKVLTPDWGPPGNYFYYAMDVQRHFRMLDYDTGYYRPFASGYFQFKDKFLTSRQNVARSYWTLSGSNATSTWYGDTPANVSELPSAYQFLEFTTITEYTPGALVTSTQIPITIEGETRYYQPYSIDQSQPPVNNFQGIPCWPGVIKLRP